MAARSSSAERTSSSSPPAGCIDGSTTYRCTATELLRQDRSSRLFNEAAPADRRPRNDDEDACRRRRMADDALSRRPGTTWLRDLLRRGARAHPIDADGT